MKCSTLSEIFLRSLTMQASFSTWRMQGLGFAFTMLPRIRRENADPAGIAAAFSRHLQMFNTHPYLASAVIGSVVKIEEEGDPEGADHFKRSVMGPYAAIGDAFFWGALRSLAAAASVFAALMGAPMAPWAFLLIYSPAHLWVRGKGFWEGYRRGKGGIDFVRGLNLPALTARIRAGSLVLVAVLAAWATESARRPADLQGEILLKAGALLFTMLCYWGIRKGISSVKILYGMTLLCVVLSI